MLEKSPLVWYLGGGFFVVFFTSCHLTGNLEVSVAMALREGGGTVEVNGILWTLLVQS